MPRVQEYTPEQEAQGPVGQTSPMLEQVSMFGRGIADAGRDIQDAGSILRQRQTQAETSDAYASVAEQRAQFMDRIQDETAKGTLDVGKVKDDYQKWVEDQYDSYDTPGGKDAFTRASARTGGALLMSASRGYAAVQGKKAADNLVTLTNTNSNLAMKDPNSFPDLYSAQTEAIQAQVESGALTQTQADQLHKSAGIELAKGAVRGYMQSDYNNIKAGVVSSDGKIDPNTPAMNTAIQKLNGGVFDEFLDSDHKKALEQEIRQNQSAAQTAGIQALSAKKLAVDAQGEQFKSQAYEQIRTGKYDPAQSVQAFRAGLITADEQLKLNHLADTQTADESPSNPAAFNSLMQRVLSPDNSPGHISDPMQLAYMVKKNAEDLGPGSQYIGKGDFDKLTQAIGMVPANRVNSYNEAQLLNRAKETLGTSDPNAHYKLMQFTNDLQMAKQNALQSQQPIGPLLDPSSKDYFGNKLQKYLASPTQILAAQADQARGTTVAPTNIQTQPGVIPTPSTPQKAPDFASMSLDDLRKLNPSSLSVEQRNAARARATQLRGGK